MRKMQFILVILIGFGATLFSQNRVKFKYKLSQKAIDNAHFTLKNGANGTLKICEGVKLRCILKLDSKGTILVDFWRILPKSDSCKGMSGIVNSETPFNIESLPKLIDGRDSIGKPTRKLKVPFNGGTFGIAILPFRYRGSEKISTTEIVNETVTSPKPDITFTCGWAIGKSVITNRSIINYSATFGGFIGLTTAEIKDGVVKSSSLLYGTSKSTKQVQTNPALSYGGCITIARNNLGLLLAVGIDNSIGAFSSDWIYQKKLWVGVGLSASLGTFSN